MDINIIIGEETFELRAVEKAKLNLTHTSITTRKGKAIVPETLRGGTILGTHGLTEGVYEDAKVQYLVDGSVLEKTGKLTVAADQISF